MIVILLHFCTIVTGRTKDSENQHKQLAEERLKVLTQHKVSSYIKIYQ